MTYDVLGPGPLDYLPCRYGASKLLFRGPKRNLQGRYLAFLGATETYGKFIEHPFPQLVENVLGTACVNFGQINAGIDAFATDPFALEATDGAELTVIQILGAQNMSNRFYSVHPRRNDRFVEASALLRAIFREVDFTDFAYNKHMLQTLMRASTDRFDAVRQELQDAWLARMKLLLRQINGKTLLLWLADHAPELAEDARTDDLSRDPLFVTREMIEELRPIATDILEVVTSQRAREAGTAGMLFNEMDAPAAAEMMGPIGHQEAADALIKKIKALK